MKKILLPTVTLLFSLSVSSKTTPVYLDPSAPLEDRVEDALSRMTLEEKIGVIHAQSKFSSAGVPRLGIPELWTTDGPHGIRPEVLWDEWEQAGWTNDSCIAFPALTCLAATWDPEVSYLYGKSIGEEARYRKKDILLGPGVNILRTPLNGRNFEYMGEDPYLASVMVVPYVKGVQDNGVAACVKHYALNNNEVNRHMTNVIVDDRTLYEIYLPAFKAAVEEGHAWSIMGSYNLYNDEWNCHNSRLLNDVLKGEWDFDGVVVSDWGGTHITDQAITNGLDLEFGSWTNGLSAGTSNAYDNYFMAYPYLEKIKSGEVGTEELDNKVRRVLRLMFRTNMDSSRPYGSMASESHIKAAHKIGSDGIVLLKNDGNILPLSTENKPTIAVIGENAIKMMTVGGGSSSLKAKYEISPLEGIRNHFGDKANVVYARGYVGDPSGEYNGVVTGQDLSDNRSEMELIKEAREVATNADYVIIIGGLNKSAGQDCEDSDRADMKLPYNQDKLIEAVAEVNPKTIYINISGNPVEMPWVDQVPVILQGWYLGSEAGNALASVLSGEVNPSGKLPMTFPQTLDQVESHRHGSYLGKPRNDGTPFVDNEYAEGIYVGYRGMDKNNFTPLFPFGHGLSYTDFKYGDIKTDLLENGLIELRLNVTNSGKVAGAEVAQLYISDPECSVPRPVKELKGFKKVYLEPGETREIVFQVSPQDLSYFDVESHDWRLEPGMFEASVGSSSKDIRSKTRFAVD